MDVNNIFVDAQHVNHDNLNCETIVNVKFSTRDDNSGYNGGYIELRDPNGITHGFYIYHAFTYPTKTRDMYFKGDPTVYKEYEWTIVLPEGSANGIWGISYMHVKDKAGNTSKYDFTETIRFDVDIVAEDINGDGIVNIQDLVIVSNSIGNEGGEGDVNRDGIVDILDMVQVSNAFSNQ